MKKAGRNDKCNCGSGKKYKFCCLLKSAPKNGFIASPVKSHYEKAAKGKLPFNSRIISKSCETSSVEISDASVTINGETTILIQENIKLSTNTVSGDKTEISAAIISFPDFESSKGKIETIGNAQVLNEQKHLDIEINSPKNKLTIGSSKDLFASLRINTQRSEGFNYLTILFGVKNKIEFINNEGRKNRSDIAIYPSGNGKFIRISDDNGDYDSNWEITNEITYETKNRIMYPSSITLHSKVHSEKLVLNFDYQNGKVILINGKFI